MCWLEDIGSARSAKAVAEVERAERAAKTARLKSLRMAQILLREADPYACFTEELDCSLLVEALTAEPNAYAWLGFHEHV